MSRKLSVLISRHTTQWFHRENRDELSPALSVRDLSDRILQFMHARKLSLSIPELEFRRNICEFVCTYYVAKKRNLPWRGPMSSMPRPRNWNDKCEQEWQDYIRFHHFSAEFWHSLWESIPEAIWESRVSGWRDAFEYVVLHYVNVQPHKLESYNDLMYDESEDVGGVSDEG